MAQETLLVPTSFLYENLRNPHLMIIDCRWVLGQPGLGKQHYEEEHIPSAVHLDIDTQLSGKEGPGRHPIPRKRDFENTLSELGISREHHIIVYDQGSGAPAARLWWLLRYFGHENVSVLDGGWALWKKENRPTTTEIPLIRKTKFVARAKHNMVIDKAGVDNLRDDPNVILIDARSPERYRGEVEPIDPKAGHIPGAVNHPFTENLDTETGLFLSSQQLKQKFQTLDVDKNKEVICYCGSGVTACTNILALKLAGFDAKLYEGSWSDWSKDDNLPVSTGSL